MSFQNTSTPPSRNWWSRGKEKGLADRIGAVNRFRDPQSNADEVLRAARIVLFVLLLITAAISAFSYLRQFSPFPFWLALAISVALPCAIEFGKNYCTTWAIRTPFFLGWRHIGAAPENTFRWAALALVGIVAFAASIYNSTSGARILAERLDYEAKFSDFSPNTADIDAQLSQAQGRIERNNKNTWKGQVVWASQKANAVEARNIEKLQAQRASRIERQRADWEAKNTADAAQRGYTGKMVLAAGGWIELIQILLMFLRVSCEKSLNARMSSPTPKDPSVSRNPQPVQGFNRPAYPSNHSPGNENPVMTDQPRNRTVVAGFAGRNTEPPQPEYYAPQPPTVAQSEAAVAQSDAALSGVEADEAILYHLGQLQKERGQFARRDIGNKEGIAKRTHGKLTALFSTLCRCTELSVQVGDKTLRYILENTAPELKAAGYPFDISNITLRIYEVCGIEEIAMEGQGI